MFKKQLTYKKEEDKDEEGESTSSEARRERRERLCTRETSRLTESVELQAE
jgi:hypothetical protein